MTVVKTCAICGKTSDTTAIHVHHVLGRLGKEKNEPWNLVELCWYCHQLWHTEQPEDMADKLYRLMKKKYGDLFPMKVNGRPYYTKWLMCAEERQRRKHER